MQTPLDESAFELALAVERKRRNKKGQGTIARGSGNRQAVEALQRRLSDLGHAVSTDGVFGPETEKAVKRLQKRTSAKVDGIVGKQTLNRLLKAKPLEQKEADPSIDAITKAITPNAKKAADAANEQGRTGRGLGDIRAVQEGGGSSKGNRGRGKAGEKRGDTKGRGSKTKKGPHGGTVDAQGKETASAKTGPIGSTKVEQPTKMTWEDGKRSGSDPTQDDQPQNTNPAFNEKHSRDEAGKFARKGDSGESVANTQEALNQVDKAGLKKDGQFGPKTDQAVRKFQGRVEGLTVDGIVGPQTSASLRRRLRLVKRKNSQIQTPDGDDKRDEPRTERRVRRMRGSSKTTRFRSGSGVAATTRG